MENKEKFQYNYSAKEQEEIREIRRKYTPAKETEDKLARLRRLDESVTQKATAVSLILGVMGALILGGGMSLAMTTLGEAFGLSGAQSMALGVLIGIVGIVLVCLAYPVYNRMARKQRERIAPEIMRLTDELLK